MENERNDALAEGQRTQIALSKRVDDALERAQVAEERLVNNERTQEKDNALKQQKIEYLERDLE